MKFFTSIFIFFIYFFSCNAYSVSRNGEEFIKKHESCKLTAYWDSNGYSIGYGHHSKSIKKGQKISKAQADKYFHEDMKSVNESIDRLISELPVKHKFSQKFIDALGDMVYNCGENGVRKSLFWQRMMKCRKNNKNDMNFAIAGVKSSRISCKGHIQRRYEEHIMMLS